MAICIAPPTAKPKVDGTQEETLLSLTRERTDLQVELQPRMVDEGRRETTEAVDLRLPETASPTDRPTECLFIRPRTS